MQKVLEFLIVAIETVDGKAGTALPILDKILGIGAGKNQPSKGPAQPKKKKMCAH